MKNTQRTLIGAAVATLALFAGANSSCKRGEARERAGAEKSAGEEQPAQQVVCGKATCGAGEVCCNPSCGICTAPDGMCTQQFCDETPTVTQGGDPPPAPAAETGCDHVRCEPGTHCELVQVQCIRAPCDPVPQCVAEGDASTKGGTGER
jgi:hypothetical protein